MHAFDGVAIVYCEGGFNSPNGKTAHGLVRFTDRYQVCCVIDSKYSGADSGQVLDRRPNRIPVVESLEAARHYAERQHLKPTHFVIGLAPDGGRLPGPARKVVAEALQAGLNVDCGLHDYLSDDAELTSIAARTGARIRDVRKPPPISALHFFSGQIERVGSLRVAVLGTDSAVGKRTTAWLLVHALRKRGYRAELIGTGQTAWMQGARYSLVLDSLVNDFVSGEIEHAIVTAWNERKPHVLVLEGQGSLLNPAYPGGFELLAAGRPHLVILQHAPARQEYDGFPGYPLHPLARQIEAIRVVSDKPVCAVTLNHEGIEIDQIPAVCRRLSEETGLPVLDVLEEGAEALVDLLHDQIPSLEADERESSP